MAKLIIVVGIAGSGKSTFIRNHLLIENPGAVVVSTDEIRCRLCGDEIDQSKNAEVFETAHREARESLRAGKTVIFDATNISRRSRRSLLCGIGKIRDLFVECHVLLCTVEQSLKNQQNRDRKVPEYALIRQMASFQMPENFEGIDAICYHNLWREDELIARLLPKLYDVDQTGKWHVENAGVHTALVHRAALASTKNKAVHDAAFCHDIGKVYTRTEDENGAHFYGHDRVSTYLYLCARASDGELSSYTQYVARLIENHDNVYRTGFSPEDFQKKYGTDLYHDLMRLRSCDVAGMISPEEYKNMPLLCFVNIFPDWEKRLKSLPMHINIVQDGDYYLFKYTQYDSDMSYRCVRESRGCILKRLPNGSMKYVCRPFDKFFNYGEDFSADIDWTCARVTEKVDGSLMKCWHDGGRWHLSTNGMIDARDANAADTVLSFADVFERASTVNLDEFCKYFDKSCTYMFELTSRETRLVVDYDDGVYYLACRETKSGREIFQRPCFPKKAKVFFPKTFDLTSMDDVLTVVNGMSKNEEGVVVNDFHGNRVKVKSPEYLMAAHLRMNGVITDRRLFEYIRDDKIDDFIAYVPKERRRVQEMLRKIQCFCEDAESAWKEYRPLPGEDRKDFAERVKKSPMWPYIFFRERRENADPYTFLMCMPVKKALQNIAKY